MYNVVTDKSQFWLIFSPEEIDRAVKEFEERMETDEEFRMLYEGVMRRYTEQSASVSQKQSKKLQK